MESGQVDLDASLPQQADTSVSCLGLQTGRCIWSNIQRNYIGMEGGNGNNQLISSGINYDAAIPLR